MVNPVAPGVASAPDPAPALLIRLDPRDTVAVTPEDLEAGIRAAVPGESAVLLAHSVKRGHKVALGAHAAGEPVIKYGHPIGAAIADIAAGDWVHVHNLASGISGELDYGQAPASPAILPTPAFPAGLPDHFMGYRREDGLVGIRNQIWIIPTVGCVNGVADRIAAAGNKAFGHERCGDTAPGAGGLEVLALTHPYGCSQLGDDLAHTRRILASLARHPNAAGVLVLGLGCENNLIDEFLAEIGERPAGSIESIRLQDVDDEVEAAMAALGRLAAYASRFVRERIPASELVIGLKCGGSDGFSGITANPMVGRISDLAVAAGGSALLTEVPEMFGAEDNLLDRAASPEVWRSTVGMVNHWKAYFLGHGQGSHENPSPGNREGGITTIEEKSLGCVRKAGSTRVVDIIPYGGRRAQKGLSLVSGPGNDLVSSTALAAAGAQLIIFTTGRGTPFGSIVPTIKVSTTTNLALRKPGWIDWDAGPLLGGTGAGALAASLWQSVVDTASGRPTRSEVSGYREIAIFKDGVTL
ncbi:MAG: altronate dehydratase family protein [Rectinemataceae bacterium]|nr:altronate dehydratase family protein [Rectinemataceae bacterium]